MLAGEVEIGTASDTGSDRVSTADTDAVSISFVPTGSPRRRIRFVERDDGPRWWWIDHEWTGCRWRPVGREPVNDVDVSCGGGFTKE